jgi:hypothetical protein
VYYDNASVGHNKLGTFMTEISRMANFPVNALIIPVGPQQCRFFNTFSVCEFERACNSNEDALLVLAPVFSSTSTVILLWDKARKSILSGK